MLNTTFLRRRKNKLATSRLGFSLPATDGIYLELLGVPREESRTAWSQGQPVRGARRKTKEKRLLVPRLLNWEQNGRLSVPGPPGGFAIPKSQDTVTLKPPRATAEMPSPLAIRAFVVVHVYHPPVPKEPNEYPTPLRDFFH